MRRDSRERVRIGEDGDVALWVQSADFVKVGARWFLFG